MNELETYYNKFNEEKRLNSRHGQVEYQTTMHYLREFLRELEQSAPREEIRILDVGAGTGRYAIPLSEEGYDVTAVEPVHHNLGRIKANGPKVKAYEGHAEHLKRFQNERFSVILLLGPLYHLKREEDRLAALSEAKRLLAPGGRIFCSYILNEYAVLTYAFKERHIREALATGALDETYHCTEKANPLYTYARPEDIYRLSEQAGLKRVKILSADGAANHMRPFLNALDEDEFEEFIRYHLSTCERPELLGAGCHILDILGNEE